MSRVFGIGTSLLLGTAVLVAIVALLLGGTGDTDPERRSQVIAVTAFAVAITSSIALAGLVLIKRPSVILGLAFIVTSVIWLVLCMRLFFNRNFLNPAWGPPEHVKHWGWTAFLALIAELMVATSAVIARGRQGRVFLGLTGVSATIATVLSAMTIQAEYASHFSESAARRFDRLELASALAFVVTLVCMLLTPGLERRRTTSR